MPNPVAKLFNNTVRFPSTEMSPLHAFSYTESFPDYTIKRASANRYPSLAHSSQRINHPQVQLPRDLIACRRATRNRSASPLLVTSVPSKGRDKEVSTKSYQALQSHERRLCKQTGKSPVSCEPAAAPYSSYRLVINSTATVEVCWLSNRRTDHHRVTHGRIRVDGRLPPLSCRTTRQSEEPHDARKR